MKLRTMRRVGLSNPGCNNMDRNLVAEPNIVSRCCLGWFQCNRCSFFIPVGVRSHGPRSIVGSVKQGNTSSQCGVPSALTKLAHSPTFCTCCLQPTEILEGQHLDFFEFLSHCLIIPFQFVNFKKPRSNM